MCANPEATEATKPVFVMVAALLYHCFASYLPELGNSCVVEPTQMASEPWIEISGLSNTTTAEVLSEEHPVAVFVYTNFTEPPSTPMTLPSMETVAISTFTEFQVPPDVGNNWVESPAKIVDAPEIETTGVS